MQVKLLKKMIISDTRISEVNGQEILKFVLERLYQTEKIARCGSYQVDLEQGTWTGTKNFYEIFGFEDSDGSYSIQEFQSIVHPEDFDAVMASFNKSLEDNLVFNMRYRCIHRLSGQTIWIDSHSFIYRNAQGKPYQVLGVKQDVTDQVLQSNKAEVLHNHLVHLEKLSLLGEVRASLAHEITNPVAIIQSALRHMSRYLKLKNIVDSEIQDSISRCNKAIERIVETTKNLRNFARKESEVLTTIDLNQTIIDYMKSLGMMFEKSGISVEMLLENVPIIINLSPARLQQMLTNLMSNAKDATENQEFRRIVIRTKYAKDEGLAILEVADNGHGIDPKIKAKLFENFFTTKAHGQGTGLGLGIVREITEKAGGKISVESSLGQGSTFRIRIPLSTLTPTMQSPKQADFNKPFSGRVLVVEDHDDVRELLCEILEDLGFEVIESVDGEDAMQKFASYPSINLVITDLKMPKICGRTFVKFLHENDFQKSGRVFLVTSLELLEDHSTLEVDGVIPKPFSADSIYAMLQKSYMRA